MGFCFGFVLKKSVEANSALAIAEQCLYRVIYIYIVYTESLFCFPCSHASEKAGGSQDGRENIWDS